MSVLGPFLAQWEKVGVFFMLRLTVAACVESMLLLDRAMYLQQQGVEMMAHAHTHILLITFHTCIPVGLIATYVATSNVHAPSNSWYTNTSHPHAHTSLTGYNTEIVPVFDPKFSPRNLVIVASLSTHTLKTE